MAPSIYRYVEYEEKSFYDFSRERRGSDESAAAAFPQRLQSVGKRADRQAISPRQKRKRPLAAQTTISGDLVRIFAYSSLSSLFDET